MYLQANHFRRYTLTAVAGQGLGWEWVVALSPVSILYSLYNRSSFTVFKTSRILLTMTNLSATQLL